MTDRPPGTGEQDAEDKISAMPRDPESVFVYWDLRGPRSVEVARDMGARCEWVLRILDLSEGTSSTVTVDLEAGSHYVHVRPGRTYGFELAARAKGKWRTVCRTERVRTPPGKPVRAAADQAAEAASAADLAGRRGRMRVTARGWGVPGLNIDSTPLGAGSSSWGGSRVKG